ncbi:unnamed protein product, partial [Staurois parvus]
MSKCLHTPYLNRVGCTPKDEQTKPALQSSCKLEKCQDAKRRGAALQRSGNLTTDKKEQTRAHSH